MKIQGRKTEYEIVIGIEIHAQLNVKHKLFSYSKAESGMEANPFLISQLPERCQF